MDSSLPRPKPKWIHIFYRSCCPENYRGNIEDIPFQPTPYDVKNDINKGNWSQFCFSRVSVQISRSSGRAEFLPVATGSSDETEHPVSPKDFFLKKGSSEGSNLAYREIGRKIGICFFRNVTNSRSGQWIYPPHHAGNISPAGRMGKIERWRFIDSQLSGWSKRKRAPETAVFWNSPPRLPSVL